MSLTEKSKNNFSRMMKENMSVQFVEKFQGTEMIQRGMLKFTLKDSPSLASLVRRHSGLGTHSKFIIAENVMVLIFQDKRVTEEASIQNWTSYRKCVISLLLHIIKL